MNAKIRRLTESAVMLALATVLSLLPIYRMPQGGSITLFSMVPILLIAWRYGVKWGMFTGFVFSLLQLLLGGLADLRGYNFAVFVGSLFFDYFFAFAALGLAGIFRRAIKREWLSIVLGSVVAVVVRFACHFISGVVFWSWMLPGSGHPGFSAVGYSLVYNAAYMGPDFALSLVGILVISGTVGVSRLMRQPKDTENVPRK